MQRQITEYINTHPPQSSNASAHLSNLYPDQTPAAQVNTASSTDNTITNKTYNDLTNITIKQYNIRHKDTASYDTLKQLKGNEIMLLQEPYLVNKRLAYTPLSHKTRLPNTKDDWVSIVLPEAIDGKTQKLGQYCNKNMIFTKTREWLGKLSLILASIYMPKNETSPDIGNDIIDNIRGATKEARKIGAPLIMGADTNAKHKKLWNSRSTCPRGRQLAQLFKELDLIVINNGINTTYQNTMGGSSTIDITITNRKGFEILKNWEVDNETSLSDHKIIKFQVNKTKNKPLIVPDLKNIDWPTFEATCKDSSETKPFKYKKVTDSKKNISTIDSNLKHITDILEHAFDKACPKKKIEMNGKTPSINPKIKNHPQHLTSLLHRPYKPRTNVHPYFIMRLPGPLVSPPLLRRCSPASGPTSADILLPPLKFRRLPPPSFFPPLLANYCPPSGASPINSALFLTVCVHLLPPTHGHLTQVSPARRPRMNSRHSSP